MKRLLTVFLLALICLPAFSQTIYYVNSATGSDAYTGVSWTRPFATLNRALYCADTSSVADVQVWVAQGVYTPEDGAMTSYSDHRQHFFHFYRGEPGRKLRVFGGFAGTETSTIARDTSHTTTLDGAVSGGYSFHLGVIVGVSGTADSVIIDGFTFSNGAAMSTSTVTASSTHSSSSRTLSGTNGGALFISDNSSSKILINNCTFLSNSSYPIYGSHTPGNGGAIFVTTTNMCHIENCRFNNNFSKGSGYSYFTGTYYAQGGNGGAISIINGNADIRDCTFSNNYANGASNTSTYSYGGNGSGGAVSISRSDSTTINSCTFNGNYTKYGTGSSANGLAYGGGISVEYSTLRVTGCSFTGCYVSDLPGYYGAKFGGALFSNGGTTIINACHFIHDSVLSAGYGSGYSLNIGGGVYGTRGVDSIFNCSFQDCWAINGSALYLYSPFGSSYVEGCNISHNGFSTVSVDSNYGGAIRTDGNTIISNCIIDSNHSSGICNSNGRLILKNSTISNNVGGIVSTESHLELDSTLILGNNAPNGGGLFTADSSLILNKTVFKNNSATGSGGAIYAVNSSRAFKCSKGIFEGNSAASGGAIFININSSYNDTLSNNIFYRNVATGTGGGAVHLNGARHYILSNTFLRDSATGNGGALRIEGTGGFMKLVNNVFSECYSGTRTGSSDTAIETSSALTVLGNLYSTTNPQFIDSSNPMGGDHLWMTGDDGLNLRRCSPAVNSGLNGYVTADLETDIKGDLRINEGTVDMGAYESSSLGGIRGESVICSGVSYTYFDSTSGGTWSVSDTSIAVVSTSGVVTGRHSGTVTLSYTATGTCTTSSSTDIKRITIESPAGNIYGTDSFCHSIRPTYTDSVIGGTWSHTNIAIGSIDSAGQYTGTGNGIDTVIYTVRNICGTTRSFKRIVVEWTADAITGLDTVCRGATIVLTDNTLWGRWSVSDTSTATINPTSGALTGVARGSVTASYTVSNHCGTTTTTRWCLVEAPPSRIVLYSDTLCVGMAVYPFDSVPGGVWHLSNTGMVTGFDSSTGFFNTTAATGRDTLSYTIANSCGINTVSRALVIVNLSVGPLSGRNTLCVGDTATIHDSTGVWGMWRSTSLTVASVDTLGHVTALRAGTTFIVHARTFVCGTIYDSFTINVLSVPNAIISGSTDVCRGSTIALTATPSGGRWSAVNVNATVTASGVVTGVILGTDSIKYIAINMCGSDTAFHRIVINGVPRTPVITGPDTVCEGSTINLSVVLDTGTGVWSYVTGHVTVTSAGAVRGISPGVDTVKFRVSNSCGTVVVIHPITVYSVHYCDSVNSVPSNFSKTDQISIAPNPTSETITIKSVSVVESLQVTDITGRILYMSQPMKKEMEVDLSSLATGCYFVRVNGNNVFKIEKQ